MRWTACGTKYMQRIIIQQYFLAFLCSDQINFLRIRNDVSSQSVNRPEGSVQADGDVDWEGKIQLLSQRYEAEIATLKERHEKQVLAFLCSVHFDVRLN